MCKSAATLLAPSSGIRYDRLHFILVNANALPIALTKILCCGGGAAAIATAVGRGAGEDDGNEKRLPIAINMQHSETVYLCISKCSMHLKHLHFNKNAFVIICTIFVFIARFNVRPLFLYWTFGFSMRSLIHQRLNNNSESRKRERELFVSPPSSCHRHHPVLSYESKLTAVAHNDECG